MSLRQSAWLVVVSGIATLVFSLVLWRLTKTEGVLVDLELARGWKTIQPILQKVGSPAALLDPSLKADYGFLLAYPLLNAALFLFVRELHPAGSWVRHPLFLIAGLALAVLMLMGDAVENAQLLSLTKMPATPDLPVPEGLFAQIVSLLGLFSRVKWASVGLAGLLLGIAFLGIRPPWVGILLPLSFLIAGGLCVWGVAADQAKPIQWSVLAFGTPWIGSTLYAAWTLWRGPDL